MLCLLAPFQKALTQDVPITNYAVDLNGQVQLTVASDPAHYYVLQVRHDAKGVFERHTSITPGQNGTTVITEPLAAYPADHYRIAAYPLNHPADTDGDGKDDLEEWNKPGLESPLNSAHLIDFSDGVTCIPDRSTFKKLSYQGPGALEEEEEVKFFIHNRDAAEPELYFINSNTYTLHTPFANAIGYTNDGTLMTGTITFHPRVPAANGILGVYRFFFHPSNTFTFDYVQKAMELLAANMPFLKNNLSYYPLAPQGLALYEQEQEQYKHSRIPILLEDDLYADVNYLALHESEGYGRLRILAAQETPGSRDIVLCESLPNELPRVGGMITTVMQTPLSHVNLRAIQDNVPNAFIRNALQDSGIVSLIGKYVYYKAGRAGFTLREASVAEVNAFYASIRPAQIQLPIRDLSQQKILPLDSISFEQSASFGVKCANVATMRGFGFPEGTIPEGFGIPFYFYDAFMQYNGFYAQAQEMMQKADFQTDVDIRIARLKAFREAIKNASMPGWMMDALSDLQQSFPAGSSIRCRSSTNNEDLPGFNGAGLYDSRTHHPDEGHLSKTIKQIYAAMWNFRAFEEREFYRVDHFTAAMGVLVHQNFENEKANGVGVSTDPIYQTSGTYYLNTQVGDDLVTNPDAQSVPEEILLDAVSEVNKDFVVISHSNQAPADTLILSKPYLDQMREYLGLIHERFRVLYHAEDKEAFAMEIEYKIAADGQLTIKQARPWATYWAGQGIPGDSSGTPAVLKIYPNPVSDMLYLDSGCNCAIDFALYNALGQKMLQTGVDFRNGRGNIPFTQLGRGVYWLVGTDQAGKRWYTGKVMKP